MFNRRAPYKYFRLPVSTSVLSGISYESGAIQPRKQTTTQQDKSQNHSPAWSTDLMTDDFISDSDLIKVMADKRRHQAVQTSRGMCFRNVGTQIVRKVRREIDGPYFLTIGGTTMKPITKFDRSTSTNRIDCRDQCQQTSIRESREVEIQTESANSVDQSQQYSSILANDASTQYSATINHRNASVQFSTEAAVTVESEQQTDIGQFLVDSETMTSCPILTEIGCQTAISEEKSITISQETICQESEDEPTPAKSDSDGSILNEDVLDALINFKPCPVLSIGDKQGEIEEEKTEETVTAKDFSLKKRIKLSQRSRSADCSKKRRRFRSKSEVDHRNEQKDEENRVNETDLNDRTKFNYFDATTTSSSINYIPPLSTAPQTLQFPALFNRSPQSANNYRLEFGIPASAENHRPIYVTDNISSSGVIGSLRSIYKIIVVNKTSLKLWEPAEIDPDRIGLIVSDQICVIAFEFTSCLDSVDVYVRLFLSVPNRLHIIAVIVWTSCDPMCHFKNISQRIEEICRASGFNLTMKMFNDAADAAAYIHSVFVQRPMDQTGLQNTFTNYIPPSSCGQVPADAMFIGDRFDSSHHSHRIPYDRPYSGGNVRFAFESERRHRPSNFFNESLDRPINNPFPTNPIPMMQPRNFDNPPMESSDIFARSIHQHNQINRPQRSDRFSRSLIDEMLAAGNGQLTNNQDRFDRISEPPPSLPQTLDFPDRRSHSPASNLSSGACNPTNKRLPRQVIDLESIVASKYGQRAKRDWSSKENL